jgi:hypothetical protein
MRRAVREIILCLAGALIGCGDAPPDGGDGGVTGDGSTSADAPAPGQDIAGGGFDGPSINRPDGPIPDGGILVHDGSVLCFLRSCQGHVYQCGDCMDNDNDNRIDSEDPDCLGACQNNEAGFFGAIPGQNRAPCKMDCYFDQDTGAGNDDCEWNHRCDPHEVAPAFDPETGCNYDEKEKFPGGATCADKRAMQSATCKKVCGPLTPNGCDCFGCCVIPPSMSTTEGVWLGSFDANGKPTCDLAHATDKGRCRPCQIVQGCWNSCGRCELCIGKNTLPPDCYGPPVPDGGVRPDGGRAPDGGLTIPDGGIPGQCEPGVQPCGLPGQPPCGQGFYCITGCCQPIIP